MKRILAALKAVTEEIRQNGIRLAAARAAYSRQHRIAVNAHRAFKRAGRKADQLRAAGNPKRAARFDGKAARKKKRSQNAALAAQRSIARIKRLAQSRHDLKAHKVKLGIELREWKEKHGVTIKGNKATGGTKRQRLRAVALECAYRCATGKRANFYSQPGAWDVDHAITGESRDKRSDCSQWVTAVYKAAGLSDPNGNQFRGGYTGTLGSHGREVPRSQIKPGDLVLYGSAPFFHVEMYVGPGEKTIGHGSAPIDPGVIDLVPGPKQIRSYV